jgi:DNA repair photolyase
MNYITDLSTHISTLSITPTSEKLVVRVNHCGETHQLTVVGDVRGGISSIVSALDYDAPIEIRLGEHTDQLVQSPRFVTIYGKVLTALQSIKLSRLMIRSRSSAIYLLAPILRQFESRVTILVPVETPNLKVSSQLIKGPGCSLAERISLVAKLSNRGIHSEIELNPIFKGFGESSSFASFIKDSPAPVRIAEGKCLESELILLNRELKRNQLLLRMISRSVRLRERFCQLLASGVESSDGLHNATHDLQKMA